VTAAVPPPFVQVTEVEFRLTLSRQAVRAGRVSIEVLNFGTDTHDLVVQRRARGARPLHVEPLQPKERAELDVRLPPGKYDLWCSIPGHRDRGMHAVLTVRR
jgi:hypothetical protein